jgi:hypothetical protein
MLEVLVGSGEDGDSVCAHELSLSLSRKHTLTHSHTHTHSHSTRRIAHGTIYIHHGKPSSHVSTVQVRSWLHHTQISRERQDHRTETQHTRPDDDHSLFFLDGRSITASQPTKSQAPGGQGPHSRCPNQRPAQRPKEAWGRVDVGWMMIMTQERAGGVGVGR